MTKYPSEVFGHTHRIESPTAHDKEKYWCPFVDKRCNKQSRLVSIPFGVCMVHYDGEEIALCPRRFLENLTVFKDIAKHCFGSEDNIIVFPEVGLRNIGNFDFVMVKHKPFSTDIEDFAVVELQTGQTTGTGALVKGFQDFLSGKKVSETTYGFGINYYDIWKRTFTQVLNKGIVVEGWGKRIYWVCQEPVYRYFIQKYRISDLGYDETHATVFAIYDVKQVSDKFFLFPTRKTSATVDDLFLKFRNNPNLPPLDSFIKALRKRIAAKPRLEIRLKGS